MTLLAMDTVWAVHFACQNSNGAKCSRCCIFVFWGFSVFVFAFCCVRLLDVYFVQNLGARSRLGDDGV